MSQEQPENTTNYDHPRDPNLNDVHKAMDYLPNGDPALRVLSNIQGDITITGDVTIPGTVTISSTPEDPVHTHVTEVGTSGILDVPYMPIGGTVTVNQPVAVTDNNGSLTVDGTINIGTMPEVEIKNDAGNPIPVAWTYGNGATLIPWNVQVARGLIPGVTGLSISGYRASSGTGFYPAWEGADYTFFTTAQVVRVWSASASDTNVSVRIDGLDADYVSQTETVVLTNGATGVLTTKLFLRINSISLTRVPQNVGTIHAGNSAKTITLAYIGTVDNQSAGRSQMTVYTVPAGFTFYLSQSNWYQSANQTAAYRSWTRAPSGLITVILTFPILDSYNSVKVVPRPYPEKTDIQWQASVSNNQAIGGQIEGYLIQNGL